MKIKRLVELDRDDMKGVMSVVNDLMCEIEEDEARSRIIEDIETKLQILAQKAFDAGLESTK